MEIWDFLSNEKDQKKDTVKFFQDNSILTKKPMCGSG